MCEGPTGQFVFQAKGIGAGMELTKWQNPSVSRVTWPLGECREPVATVTVLVVRRSIRGTDHDSSVPSYRITMPPGNTGKIAVGSRSSRRSGILCPHYPRRCSTTKPCADDTSAKSMQMLSVTSTSRRSRSTSPVTTWLQAGMSLWFGEPRAGSVSLSSCAGD